MEDKTNKKEENQIEETLPNFGDEIDNFIKHIEAQSDMVPLVMGLVSTKLIQESRLVDKYIKENEIIEKKDDKNKQKVNLLIPNDKIKGFFELTQKVETTSLAFELLPKNFVVSFVSQYDAYLGNMIKTLFYVKPELLNSSEKNMQFSDLLDFISIKEARGFIIEKEIESVLRESHLKQFQWLENKLNMTLRKDLPSFSDFIEITERRNLFVHCNGVISRQYIENCKEHNVKNIEKAEIGVKLTASPNYYSKCYSVLFEIGVKLGHVLWRKLQPGQIKEADIHLNNVCYNLLVKGHNKLALNLLSFATEVLKKHYDQEIVCIFTINKALAHYLSDKKKEAKDILSKHDWSATNDKFKLAISVLNEEFEESIELMKSIGDSNKDINKDTYREWPLFRTLRKREDFKSTYKEIFNEELVYIESKPKSLEDILTELKQIKKEVKEGKIAANNI